MRFAPILLGLVTIGVVVALVVWREPGVTTGPARGLGHFWPTLFDELSEGRVDIEAVDGATGRSLRYVVGEEGLVVVGRTRAPVAREVGDELLGGLSTLATLETASPPSGDLGFDEGDTVVLRRDDGPDIEVRIGAPSGFEPWSYARVSGTDALWRAPSELAELPARELDAVRSRDVVPFARHRFRRVVVRPAQGEARVSEKVGAVWYRTEPRPASPLDLAFRDELLAWEGLEARRFVHDRPTDLAAGGFEPAWAEVRLESDDGEVVDLRFARPEVEVGDDGARPDEALVYVTRWDAIVAVDGGVLEWIERDADRFDDRRWFPVDMGSVVAFTIERPDGSRLAVEAARGDGWRVTEPEAFDASDDEMNLLSDGFAKLERLSRAEASALRAPGAPGDRLSSADRGATDASATDAGDGYRAELRMRDGRTWAIRVAASDLGAASGDSADSDPVPVVGSTGTRGFSSREALVFLETPYWRLRHPVLTDFAPERLGGLRVSKGDAVAEIVLTPSGWVRREGSGGREEPLDRGFVDALATRWIDLWAKEVVGPKDAPPDGLDPGRPDLRLELVGRPFDGGEVLAGIDVFWFEEPEDGSLTPLPVVALDRVDLLFRVSADPVHRLKRACPFPVDEGQ